MLLQDPPKLFASRPRRVERATVHQAAAAAASDAAVAPARFSTNPLAALMAGHVLQDGEIVLLVLKPSLWFIALSAIRFIAVVAILMIAAVLLDGRLPGRQSQYQELGLFVIAGRVMWAVLQWMGRLYVLTDMRIMRLSGVFSVDIFDCPLRKVMRTRVVRSMRERIVRNGTIEITSAIDSCPTGYWNTVSRPVEVHEKILAAISRAKQGPCL